MVRLVIAMDTNERTVYIGTYWEVKGIIENTGKCEGKDIVQIIANDIEEIKILSTRGSP